MFKKVIEFLTKKKKILPMSQRKKNEIALEYLQQIQKHYDGQQKLDIHIGSKIGVYMNSLELMVIEAKLLTGQLDATDELILELEKFVIDQTI